MAIVENGHKYGVSIKGLLSGSTTQKSKSIDYLNLQADSLGSGHSNEHVWTFANAIKDSLIGGLTMSTISTSDDTPLIEGE